MQSILERVGTVGYQGNDADAHEVAELAEDVRDAVIEYQVSPNLLVISGRALKQHPVRSTERDT